MKLNVDHTLVISQDVEVPDTCPSCSADLTAEDALLLWEYQDQSRRLTNKKLEKGKWWRTMVLNPEGWTQLHHGLHTEEDAQKLIDEMDDDREKRVDPIEDDEYEIDWGDWLPDSGEGYIYCSWECANCRHGLAQHTECRYDLGNAERRPPPGVLDLMRIDANS